MWCCVLFFTLGICIWVWTQDYKMLATHNQCPINFQNSRLFFQSSSWTWPVIFSSRETSCTSWGREAIFWRTVASPDAAFSRSCRAFTSSSVCPKTRKTIQLHFQLFKQARHMRRLLEREREKRKLHPNISIKRRDQAKSRCLLMWIRTQCELI